jgi:L-alanine-DL-glutamate epimerase-like enolase superfamily enzyme
MKIAAIRAVALTALWEDIFGGADRVPSVLLRPAAHFQTFPRRGQYAVLAEVTTDDGLTGTGEAWGMPVPEATAALVNGYLGPALIGRNSEDIEGIWRDVYDMMAALGYTRGGWMEALSGIDMALWDLRGRREGRSLSDLLGGARSDRIAVYASPVPFHETPTASAAAARELMREGFQALKVKVGRDSVATDIEHLCAVREAVGPAARLMADANAGYTVEKAVTFASAVEPLGLDWMEEPVPSERLDELAEVRRRIRIPVAAGENEFTPRAFDDLLRRGGVDILTPNVTRAGGITGIRWIAALAAERGATLSLHGVGGALMRAASLHLTAALPNLGLFECNRLPNPLRDAVATQPVRFSQGMFPLPHGPGLGIELDPRAMAPYTASEGVIG